MPRKTSELWLKLYYDTVQRRKNHLTIAVRMLIEVHLIELSENFTTFSREK